MNILVSYNGDDVEILGHINKKSTAEKFLENLRKCSREMRNLNQKTFYRELTNENEIKESYEKIYEKYSKSIVKICQKYPGDFDIIPTKELKE